MTWEQKTEMIQFLNNGEYEKALDLVIENIKSIDEQGWEMFFTGISLTKESILPLIDKHRIICEASKNEKSSSIRVSMRMALYEQIIEDNQSK